VATSFSPVDTLSSTFFRFQRIFLNGHFLKNFAKLELTSRVFYRAGSGARRGELNQAFLPTEDDPPSYTSAPQPRPEV
jgi:hypothetical protein